MGNDKLFNKKREARKARETQIIDQKPNTWLIICEGEKTEPLYFENILFKINKSLPDDYKIKCDIKGTGYNTESLVNFAERIQGVYDKCTRKDSIIYGKVFVVFDKDDFSQASFLSAIRLCEKHGHIPLWSNQAFELWFLLHFYYTVGKMNRKDYKKNLEKYIFSKTGEKFTYLKSDKNSINKIIEVSSLKVARRNARKIHEEFIKSKIKECNSESCTTVYKFFDEIDKRAEDFNLPKVNKIFSEKR